MSKRMVAGPDDALGPLSELLRQLRRGPKRGGLGVDHLQALNEHRNPFEKGKTILPAKRRPCPQDQTFHFKSIAEQARLLKKYFPNLNISYVSEIMYFLQNVELPQKADGWIVAPKEAFFGKWPMSFDDDDRPFSSNAVFERYEEILIRENLINTKMVSFKQISKLSCANRSLISHKLLGSQPRGDVFVFPVQLGECYKGKPLYKVRGETDENEFFLDLPVLFAFFLTHPDFLLNAAYSAIQIGCGGTEMNVCDRYSVWSKPQLSEGKISYFIITGAGDPYVGWASGFVVAENYPSLGGGMIL